MGHCCMCHLCRLHYHSRPSGGHILGSHRSHLPDPGFPNSHRIPEWRHPLLCDSNHGGLNCNPALVILDQMGPETTWGAGFFIIDPIILEGKIERERFVNVAYNTGQAGPRGLMSSTLQRLLYKTQKHTSIGQLI